MIFDEKFLEDVMENPIEGIVKVCEFVLERRETSLGWTNEDLDELTEAYALVQSIFETYNLTTTIPVPSVTGSIHSDCQVLNSAFSDIAQEFRSSANRIKFQSLKTRYTITLGAGFFYEFSDGDLQRIQTLISELRDLLTSSKEFAEDHRARLLKRLEVLQSELHKRVSNLDRFWGLMGDAGAALGKFGKDAKPIVDRIREIIDIIWRTQARAEELPSATPRPMLSDDDET